jgi:hypothetical protein
MEIASAYISALLGKYAAVVTEEPIVEEIILHTDAMRSDSLLPLMLGVLFPDCRVTVISESEPAQNNNEGGRRD